MAGRILVGTSSWSDPGFVADWYPRGLKPRERLPYYAERFEAVEVASTFYALPKPGSVARWVQQTPDGFTFDVKLHRVLSRHAAPLDSLPRELREHRETERSGRVVLDGRLERAMARRTVRALEPLIEAGRLGALLLQLSPAFAPPEHRLEELDRLIEVLAPHPVAVELRHRAWLGEERRHDTLAYLSERGAAFVGVDAPRGKAVTLLPPLDAVTRDDVAYLRAHGRNLEGYVRGRSVAERFGHVYSDAELGEITGRAHDLAAQVPTVHLVFNNNRSDDAPRAAARARELLGQVAEERAAA